MKSFIQSMDQFGSPFVYNVYGSEKMHKSLLGGVVSLCIYLSSLIYFLYILYQWSSGNILPKVQQQQTKITGYEEIDIEDFLKVEYLSIVSPKQDVLPLDPFGKEQTIVVSLLAYLGSPYQQVYSNKTRCPSTIGFAYPICPRMEGYKVSYNASATGNSKSVLLAALQCLGLPNCAPPEAYTQFASIPLLQTRFSLKLKEFDSVKQELVEYIQEQDVMRDPSMQAFYTFALTITHLEVNTGFLFPKIDTYKYISAVSTKIQYTSQDYIKPVTNGSVAQYVIRLDLNPVYIQKTISYPQLGEVLASIGSIYSMLLLLSTIASLFNKYRLEVSVQAEIIKIYFPHLKQLQITNNWKGKAIRIKDNQTNEYYEPESHNALMKNLHEMAKQKMNFLNMIYELSRIQFLLQAFLPQGALHQAHDIGIKWPQRSTKGPPNPNPNPQIHNKEPNDSIVTINKHKPPESLEDSNIEKIQPIHDQSSDELHQLRSNHSSPKNEEPNNCYLLVLEDFQILSSRPANSPDKVNQSTPPDKDHTYFQINRNKQQEVQQDSGY